MGGGVRSKKSRLTSADKAGYGSYMYADITC